MEENELIVPTCAEHVGPFCFCFRVWNWRKMRAMRATSENFERWRGKKTIYIEGFSSFLLPGGLEMKITTTTTHYTHP